MIILDTHIWLWWLLGDGALKKTERKKLDKLALEKLLAISWVSIWETEMLERKNRIELRPDFHTWIRYATDKNVCRVLPVDIEIVIGQRKLPEDFHHDPADRLITSTALLAGFPLATHDQKIIASNVVEIWGAGTV